MTVDVRVSALPRVERQRRHQAVEAARASVRLEGVIQGIEGRSAQHVSGGLKLTEVMTQVQPDAEGRP